MANKGSVTRVFRLWPSQGARAALTQPAATTASSAKKPAAAYGFRPFPSRGGAVSNEQVDKLRDEEGA
jgi:hypothetical protein